MSRWTEDEDAALRELAADGLSAVDIARALPGRTESGVGGRASKLKVRLSGGSSRELRGYLEDGGRLVRDEVGGVIGVRWARATRSGDSYPTRLCERLASLGWLIPIQHRENVFRWVEAA